jgi:tetratricopeptide (TPR) repeat protein
MAKLDARSGSYDEALRLSAGALKVNPNLSSAYLASAEAWQGKGDARQAQAMLQAALERDPLSLPALAMLLNFDQRQGKSQEAVTRIANLIPQHPQMAGLHFLLGLGYFNLKDLGKAEASVRQALALDPRTPDAHTLLADIYLSKGQADQAKAELRAAIEGDPRNTVNYLALAYQYEKEGNWEEAKKLCEKAHQVDSASPVVADQLATLYLDHGGDVNVALPLAQMAKQKMPDSPLAADTLGWAYYKLGSAEPAITELEEGVQKVPNNPTFQYHLGMAYLAGGHSELAREALQKALKDNPKFAQAADATAALQKISKAHP